jgi:hypothetical protein
VKFRAAGKHTLTALLLISSNLLFIEPAQADLYSFTSHTFSNCSATGRSGPTQDSCRSAYSTTWDDNNSYFTVTNGIQYWVAPATANYTITAAGATGIAFGKVKSVGAIVRAKVSLTQGSTYKILIGQSGSAGGCYSGGGGGGTFLSSSSNSPLIVAGGGGGALDVNVPSTNSANGQTTTSGGNASDGTGTGGTSGNGGNGSSSGYGSGGGGFTGDGTNSGYGYSTGGSSFTNGGTGGNSTSGYSAFGGFGGGGGTHGCSGGGGGGGGYSGGGGSTQNSGVSIGGGGGSFIVSGATNIATSNGSYAGSSAGITNLNQYNGTFNSTTYSHGYLTIEIEAVPDSTAPTFTNSTSFSIAENSSTSTNAATITVNESATITITSETDSALFTIITSDSTTARIRFLTSPNFEAPADVGTNNVYDITVRATDSAGNIANRSITITVTNVNEAPTISSPSSAATYSITQAENISSVATYAATDVDAGASLSWSISGTDAADFSIVSGTGVLTFATTPDYEAPLDSDTNNAYIIIVTVSDGSLTDTQTLTITITNANESASIAGPTVSGAVYKGITTTITVTSSVAGKVRFFVGGKRISTCLSRTTTGAYPNYSATCSWKPAVQNKQQLTATITPTDNTFSAATSAATEVQVVKRTTTR